MRKINYFKLIITVLMMSIFSTVASFAEEVNGDVVAENIDDSRLYGYHYMPEDNFAPKVNKGNSILSVQPSYYKPDYNQLPNTRNQNPYGTCWAHASMAAAEINMLKSDLELDPEEIDYSELALAYYTYNSVADPLGGTAGDINSYKAEALRPSETLFDVGGNWNLTPHVLASWCGATDESDVPYSNATAVISGGLNSKFAYKDVAHLRNYYKVSLKDDPNLAKEYITKYGALGASYYDNSAYYNDTNNCYYNDYNESTNHAISIVGWDDNFSASKFNSIPDGNGAWLIRNSWSTNKGKPESRYSYFWMSYYDKSLAAAAYAFDYESAEVYDNNYQYDGGFYSNNLNVKKAANVFTVKVSDQETLRAVGFNVSDSNVRYSIDIYENLSDASNPESGTPIISCHTEGETMTAGFYTVDLRTPAVFSKGDTFAVVISMDKAAFEKEASMNWNWCSSSVSAEANQSFVYNGSAWSDYGRSNNSNIRIKAYTVNGNGQVVEPTAVTISDGDIGIGLGEKKQLMANFSPANVTNRKLEWESLDTSVVTVDRNGKITGISLGSAVVTVRSVANPALTDSINVTVDSRVVSISVSCSENVFEGDEQQLSYTVYPLSDNEYNIDWSSSDTNIATVDKKGKITAHNVGEAVITAKIGEITGSCPISVYPKGPDFVVDMDENGKVTLTWDKDEAASFYAIKRQVDGGSAVEVVSRLLPTAELTQTYIDNPEINLTEEHEILYWIYRYVGYMGGARGKRIYSGQWYTVSYVLDTHVINTDNCVQGFRVKNSKAIGVPLMADGYMFNGWIYRKDGGNYIVSNISSFKAENVTLTARTKPITYTINFDGNGHTSGNTASQVMTYDESASLNKNMFEKDGAPFIEWNTHADGSGVSYSDQETVVNLSKDNSDVITLYAQWGCTHEYEETVATKATFTSNGSLRKHCRLCGYDTYEAIDKLSAALKSNTALTYTGSAINPEIKVSDIKGNEVAASEFDVNYTNNINAGTATATVTMKPANAKYSGSTDVNFTIGKAAMPSVVPSDCNEEIVQNKKVSDVSLPTGWEWSLTDAEKLLPTTLNASITATANYTASDKNNYTLVQKSIKIKMTSCSHLNGSAVRENEVDSTCEVLGSYDSVVYCQFCGVERSRTSYPIELKEHEYINYISDGNATCASDGTKTGHCKYNCGRTDTVTDVGSRRSDHPDLYPVEELVSAPTCQSNKIIRRKCPICGDVLADNVEIEGTRLDCNLVVDSIDKAGFDSAGRINYICTIGSHAGTPKTIAKVGSVEIVSEYTYCNAAIIPEVIVKDTNDMVIPSDYYEVTGENNINAGSAKAVVTFKPGCDKYAGTKKYDFTINKAPIPDGAPGNINTKIETDKKVSDIVLSANWKWADGDENTLLPTEIGESIDVTAVYDGADKDNYEITAVSVTILMSSCDHVGGTPVAENRTEADCFNAGYYDLVTYCEICGHEITRVGNIIPMKSHVYSSYTADGNATCKEDGTKSSYCENGCGSIDTITDAGSKDRVAHVPSEIIIDNDIMSTCQAAGSYDEVVKCTVCGVEISRNSYPRELVEHEFGDYVPNGDATCTEDGTKTAQCKFGCGTTDVKPNTGAATGHNWVRGTILKEPNYRENGRAEYACSKCHDTKTDIIPKLEYDKIVEKISGKYNVILIKGGKSEAISELVKIKGEKKWLATYSLKGIAQVSNKGIVKASKPGKTVATVVTEHGTFIVDITVTEPKVEKGTLYINKGDVVANAGFSGTNLECQYISAKPAFATVDSLTGEVTALAYGKTKITMLVCGKKFNRNVQVVDPFIFVKNPVVKVNKKISLKVKQGVKITSNWTSSDTTVATVDEKGKVTGLKPGTVTISADNNGVNISIEITVTE